MPWTEDRGETGNGFRWVRSDGAVVKFKVGPRIYDWMAFEPDPSEAYLIRYSKSGLGFPRRWKTPEAAMRAVDREYPEKLPRSSV